MSCPSLSAVSVGEEVVPASELTPAMKQRKELQRLLGKNMEVERSAPMGIGVIVNSMENKLF